MYRPLSPAAETAATRTAFAVLGLGLLARLVLAVVLDPGLDEAYAVAVSTRWQLSWFDHPPMTFWWVAAMRALATPLFEADVPAAVLRLPFVLAFTATSWLIFDLGRRLWGARAGLWALIALTLAPFFLVSAGGWMVPDGPLVLALAASARLLVEILWGEPDRPRERRLWLGLGLALGCAGLAKYHALLFALAALAFVVATPHRRRLASPWPWLAAVLAAVVVSPVLIWNAENDWVSFLFQSGRSGGGRVNWAGFGRALLGQMVWLAPWTLLGALWAAARALRADRAPSGPAAFLVAISVLPIVIFTAVPLLGGDSLPHWQMPGWLFLLPLLGRAIAEAEANAHRPRLVGPTAPPPTLEDRLPRLAPLFARIAATLLALATLAVAALRLAPLDPDLAARFRLEAPLAEATTWTGLAARLDERRLLAPGPDGRRPIVVGLRWLEAARLGEALGSRADVAVFDGDPRGFAFLTDPRAFLGRDVVLIARPKTADRFADLAPLFERIEPLEPIRVGLGRPGVVELRLALGRRLKTPYALPYPKRDGALPTRP